MSEWTAPGAPEPERERPRYGELAPEGWAPPAQDPSNPHAPVPPLAAGPRPGWAPPPKPGLIPLRPLTLGEVIAASFQVIRRNPRPTFGFALLISVVVTVVVGGLLAVLAGVLVTRIEMAATADQGTILAGSLLLFVLGGIVSTVVSGALLGVVQGIVAQEVSRATLGERLTLRALWAGVRGRFWLLIGWTLLESAAAVVAIGLVVLAVVAFAPLGTLALLLSIPLALLLGAGCLVLLVWLGTKLAFVPALLVVERLRLRPAIRRSWSLTRSSWWRVFGITLLISAIVTGVAEVVTVPISLAGSLAGGVINPNGTEDFSDGWAIGAAVLSYAVGAVFNAVSYVASAAAPTILYLDLRMRKEGLDLELQRYVEQTAAGRAEPDPYRRT